MEGPSPAEVELLELLSGYLSNPHVAERLHISVRTAESHIVVLIPKLEVADRQALVAYLTQAGGGEQTYGRVLSGPRGGTEPSDSN